MQKTAKILTCCLLVIPLIGSGPKGAQSTGEEHSTQSAILRAFLQRGGELFRRGHYQEAAGIYQSVLEASQSLQLARLAGRALGNLGSCQFALHQYQAALRLFLESRRNLEASGDASGAAVFDANIASVYIQIGEYSAAAEWVERSMARISGLDREHHLAQLQLQLATLRARQGRMADAFELFRQGLDGADRAGDLELYAIGWNRLGEELLQRGDLAQAEKALLGA